MPDPADEAPSPSASQLSGVTIRTQNSITTSLNYPTLSKSDSESVRRFLRKDDQYITEVDARHRQIAPAESTEPARPVALKFCVDSEWILSVLAMGLIKSTAGNKVDSYEALTDEDLRVFLDKKADASKETISLSTLDAVVSKTLRMDMTDRSATSRMEALFVSYHSLLRQHGLNWILQDAPKVAVQHVFSQIRPASLQSRLNDDLDLSHYSLRKDFQGFFAHATKLAEAFQLVDDGPRKRRNQGELPNGFNDGGGGGRPRNSGSGSRTSRNRSSVSETNVTTTSSSKPKTKKNPPPCPHPACQERLPEDDRLHFINVCDWATKEQKSQYKADYRKKKADKAAAAAAALVADPISSRTRSETGERKSYGGVSRIGNKKNNCNGAVQAILSDGEVSSRTVARFDDGSDETLICPTVAEKAAMMGIGRIRAIKPVVLKVALQKEDQTCEFTFSRTF